VCSIANISVWVASDLSTDDGILCRSKLCHLISLLSLSLSKVPQYCEEMKAPYEQEIKNKNMADTFNRKNYE
jgi:hypothetical protein